MRKNFGFALLACAVAPLACGAGGAGNKSNVKPGFSNSGTGNGTGGAGSMFQFGGGAGPILNTPGGGAGVDPDPGNPNITHPLCGTGVCTDFPTQPIMGVGVPANAAMLFGAPENFTAGSLCVLEPQLSAGDKPGAMMPANWVRPRFRVMAPAGTNLLEIRIHSPAEANDLVVYTTYSVDASGAPSSWYLPKEIWAGAANPMGMGPASGSGLANNAAGQPVTVTIRALDSTKGGTPIGIKGDFNIAPVVTTGSMVFWTVKSAAVTLESSKLLGFAVGDEGVANALTLANVAWTGQIGEDGGVLRGFYDKPPLVDFPFGTVRCIGCHATIPDGSGVVFTDDWPWSKAAASLAAGSVGMVPAGITPGAQAIMKMPWWGQQTMTAKHWTAGDRIMVTSYGSSFASGAPRTLAWQALPHYGSEGGVDDKVKLHKLAWINMEAAAAIDVTTQPAYGTPKDMRDAAAAAAMGTGWGIIPTGSAGASEVSPNLSHASDMIVYTTTDSSPDGHPDATSTTADIRTVPYNGHMGGVSQPLAGASDPGFLEYYPSYSSDDQLIAFTRAPARGAASPDGPYYNRFGEAMVVPAGGATPDAPAARLIANDPVQCAGDNVAAGLINSWPKWSPDAFMSADKSKTYYFLVFSSARKYADEFSKQFPLPPNPLSAFKGLPLSSQLYLATVEVDNATHKITTYPAVYIWNQNRTPGADGMGTSLQYSNLTPAWDPLKLPPLVIPEVPSDPVPK